MKKMKNRKFLKIHLWLINNLQKKGHTMRQTMLNTNAITASWANPADKYSHIVPSFNLNGEGTGQG